MRPHPFREFHQTLPEKGHAVAHLHLDYAVPDRDPLAQDPAGYPPARIQRHDGDLVGRVLAKASGAEYTTVSV